MMKNLEHAMSSTTDNTSKKRKKRTSRQVKADNAALAYAKRKGRKEVKSDLAYTTDDDNLFTMFGEDDGNPPDEDTMAQAFIGRLMKTDVYDDIMSAYIENRGGVYDIVNREIMTAYKNFVYNGSWKLDKLFDVIVFLIKSNSPINKYSISKIGIKRDNGDLPMGLLNGIDSDDYDYITCDVISDDKEDC